MIRLLNLGAKPNIISCKEGDPMLNRDTIKYLAILAMLLNHIANLFLSHPEHCSARSFSTSAILPQSRCAILL